MTAQRKACAPAAKLHGYLLLVLNKRCDGGCFVTEHRGGASKLGATLHALPAHVERVHR